MCAPYSLGNDREFVTNERVSVIGERERESFTTVFMIETIVVISLEEY